MTRAVVALGSNLGDRLAHLRDALAGLRRLGSVVSTSSIYETAPVGGPPQAAYLNAIVVLDTDLEPEAVLNELHRIEAGSGRLRSEPWGPRTLDLDLILHGSATVDDPGLTVPHPRFTERRFVLEPLVEAWPEATTPDGRSISGWLAAVAGQEVVVFGGAELLEMDDPPSNDESRAGTMETQSLSFAARGGLWVVAQALILILALVVIWVSTETMGGGGWMRGVGIALLLAGGVEAALGLAHLGTSITPYPEPRRPGHLVHGGIYRHVRHPIYGGITLGLLGAALAGLSWPGLLVALAGGAFFWQKAGFEERRLVARYPDYGAYRAATSSRMIPFVL